MATPDTTPGSATASQYRESLNLIGVLDVLRDAYELAKQAQQPALQARLMDARRQLLVAVHQSLDLHTEISELQEQLAQHRAGSPLPAANDDTPAFMANIPGRIS
jgi:hypothetical protein